MQIRVRSIGGHEKHLVELPAGTDSVFFEEGLQVCYVRLNDTPPTFTVVGPFKQDGEWIRKDE